jgi:DNA-binding XRE family transcriptional regulator
MRAARLNLIRSFVRWCGWSLDKQILSAASNERRCAGDLLGEMPTPLGIYLRLFSPLWHLVSEGGTHNKRRVRMMERSRSTPLPALAVQRRRRGLTQRQLGELSGVAHTTVQRLESLSRGAYPQTMQKLATALGVAPEELLHGESTQR